MFLVAGRPQAPASGDEKLIRAKLAELRFEPHWIEPEKLSADSAEGAIGVIVTDQLDVDAISKKRFADFIEHCEVPLLAIGEAATLFVLAYGGRVVPRASPNGSVTQVKVDNNCVLFDFLPGTIQLDDWRGSSLDSLPSGFEVTARADGGRIVAFQHQERELFAVDFSISSSKEVGRQVLDNFARYAGTFSGEL